MVTAEILCDSDVLINHLRGTRRLPDDDELAISVVSRCELFAGRDDDRRLHALLVTLTELPVDQEIAEIAGLTRRSSGIATPDALIAATALVHDLPLLTRNRRHFDRVDGLQVLDPS